MPLTLADTLTAPDGSPLPDAVLLFHAVRSSADVPKGSVSEAITDNLGAYSVTLGYGYYDIYLRPKGSRKYTKLVTNVTLDADTTETTVNDLSATYEGFDPDLVREVRSIRDGVLANKVATDQAVIDSQGYAQAANQDAAQVSSDKSDVSGHLQTSMANLVTMSSIEERTRIDNYQTIQLTAAHSLTAETAEQSVRLMIEEFNG